MMLLLNFLTLVATANAQALITSNAHHEKRQDYSALLELASSAGIQIPTDDPALLLSLAPVAGQLVSYLPTAPVLSALQTAAPSGFLSKIVHDPSYAQSFESQFAAGSSPSWFLALPSSVKDYLHTYSDYGGVATEIGNAESIIATASASETATSMVTRSTGASSQSDGSDSVTPSAQASSTLPSSGADATATDITVSPSTSGVESLSQSSTMTNENPSTTPTSTNEEQASITTNEPTPSTSTGSATRKTDTNAGGLGVAVGMLWLAFSL